MASDFLYPVKIIRAEERFLKEAAAVFASAFRSEKITSRFFNFRLCYSPRIFRAYAVLKSREYLAAGQPVLLAVAGGRVIGQALMRRPYKLPLTILAGIYFPKGALLFPALLSAVNYRGLIPALRASARPRDLPAGCFTLEAIAVDPARQGMGAGRKLLEAVREEARGSPGVYLCTAQTRNKKIYELSGYRTLEVRASGNLTVYHMFMEL